MYNSTFVIVKKFDLTYIMPILTGINQILVILGGIIIFKDHITSFGITGIIFVILGLVMLNIK